MSKELIAKCDDPRENTMAKYIFDGFARILQNNLNALFESEHNTVDLVFEQDRNLGIPAAETVQKNFYPKVLELLVWRTTLTPEDQANAVKYLTPWQRLLPLTDAEGI